MYSATFAGHVGRLAQDLLRDPQRIDVASHTDTHADIEQRLHWADDGAHKNALLDHILTERDVDQALVFTSTQRDADWLADRLAEMGHRVASLHGGMPQGRRNRVLHGLRTRDLRVLVATDVAARGIDVPTISHVINYGLPMKAEDYVHRIGRTGRAGRAGLAVTLAERRDAGMIQPHPALHDAAHPGGRDRRPGAPAPGAGASSGTAGACRVLARGRPGFGGPRQGGFGGPRSGEQRHQQRHDTEVTTSTRPSPRRRRCRPPASTWKARAVPMPCAVMPTASPRAAQSRDAQRVQQRRGHGGPQNAAGDHQHRRQRRVNRRAARPPPSPPGR